MPERRYRGESWESVMSRADLEAGTARRAEAERAKRARAARAARSAATPEPPPPTPEPPRPRRTWRDLSPDELNRYALAESRQP